MQRRKAKLDGTMLHGAVARYGFAALTVALALGLRMVLVRVTGGGAGFVLVLAATMFTALVAGTGPAIFSVAISLPLAFAIMVTTRGYSGPTQAIPLLLYAADGGVIVWVTSLMQRGRRDLALTNAELIRIDEERALALLRTKETIELAPDAYFLADTGACLIDVNRAASVLLGYSREELLKMHVVDVVPDMDQARLEKIRAELVSGTVLKAVWMQRRKDGTLVPVEVLANILPDGRWQAFARDISEAKRVAEEREKLLAALQRAVAARDDVLGIVAHDLRNPLSTIIMQVSGMKRDGSEPERRSMKPLEVISRSADRMNHLIRDLLDVAVVEAGQLKIEPEKLSAEAIAREAVDAHSSLAAAAECRLQLEAASGAGAVFGDRDRLLQVFENLIGNAIKFTKAGGQITVRVTPAEREVVFSVADTGAGIAAEHMPRLFERFWQATARASRLGAGLGLPITKGIVEAHGGRIWAESEEGRGTTFFFTIPTAPPPKRPVRPRGPERRVRRATA